MDSEFTLISHQPLPSSSCRWFFFVCFFFNLHVLTPVCYQDVVEERGQRFTGGEHLWEGLGLKGVCRVVTADSTEQTSKASSFPHDVTTQRR